MAVNVITRPGQSNGAGDENVLFLKKFSGEVLAQFKSVCKFMAYTQTRTLSGAKSAAFPIIDQAGSTYHVPGDSVYGTDNGGGGSYLSNIKGKEREIFVDDPVLSGAFVPRIDEMKNHWEVRSKYSTEIGNALAQRADRQILSTIFAAAKAAADFNATATAAYKAIQATSGTSGTDLVAAAYTAAEKFDTLNIPKEGRYFVVRPKQYYILAQVKDLLDRDIVQSNGDYSKAEILRVAGMQIVVTNNMPTTTASAPDVSARIKNHPHGGTSGYDVVDNAGAGTSVSWNKLAALAFHPAATGTVKMADISSEMENSVERQGTLLLSKYVMGHNILRPECAIRIHSDTI